jgi:hypothetical protein
MDVTSSDTIGLAGAKRMAAIILAWTFDTNITLGITGQSI